MRHIVRTGPVIVTNARNRIAYNIVKTLGRKGIPVYSADSVPRAMSFSSRYSKGHFLYPSPFTDQQGFIDCLIENIIRLRAEVLIPVFEETFLIAKHKDRLSQYVKLVLPSYDQILIAHNKDKWESVARSLNIQVPKTVTIEDSRNQKADLQSLSYPVFIKPKQGGGAWAIKQIDSSQELQTLLNQPLYLDRPWNRFFIQEKIIGETMCVAMLFCNGEYRAKIAYKQLRDYPVTGGQATLRISIRNKDAETNFQRVLEELNWHGVCQADFVVDSRTGVPYLIDINPRFWGSLVQGIACGVDFPYLIFRMAVEGDVEPIRDFSVGVTTRWLGGDLMTFIPLLKRSKNKFQFIREFVLASRGKVLFDDISITDPVPFFSWILDGIIRIIHDRSIKPSPHDSLKGIWE